MAWIESHQELARHPKTLRLARRLGVSVPAAIGHLQLLWWWAMDFAPDGSLAAFDAGEIADAVMWDGDPDVLVDALQAAKFIDGPPDHEGYVIHDWHEYAGRLIEKRQANAERMREARARNVQRTSAARAGATVPDRTGPNRTVPDRNLHPNPPPQAEEGTEGQPGVSRDVVERLAGLPDDLTAAEFHRAAEEALIEIGFACSREVKVGDRGDGHGGRLDMVAERGGERIAFEFDDRSPRQKSVKKLAGAAGVKRVVVLRCPLQGPLPSPPGIDVVIGAGRSPNVAPGAPPETVAPITSDDRQAWEQALATAEAGLTQGNAAQLGLLVLLGRAPDGGLQLRAPPGSGLKRFRNHVARALLDAGDQAASRVAIVEG